MKLLSAFMHPQNVIPSNKKKHLWTHLCILQTLCRSQQLHCASGHFKQDHEMEQENAAL